MMGIGHEEARRMSFWDFTAMRWHWNERHKSDDDSDPVEAPDADYVADRRAMLEARGIARSIH